MVFTLRFKIYLMCFFGSRVIAEPFAFSVDGKSSSPLVLKPDYAHESGFIPAIWFPHILRVTVRHPISQICQSVIRLITVNVINQSLRPSSIGVQPRKSVRLINATFDTNRDITNLFSFASGNRSRFDGLASVNDPSKDTSLRVIFKDFTKVCLRKIDHFIAPVMTVNINTLII